jgi:hypothetical protein
MLSVSKLSGSLLQPSVESPKYPFFKKKFRHSAALASLTPEVVRPYSVEKWGKVGESGEYGRSWDRTR